MTEWQRERFQYDCLCLDCGHKWSITTTNEEGTFDKCRVCGSFKTSRVDDDGIASDQTAEDVLDGDLQ